MKYLEEKIINFDLYCQNLKENYYVYLHCTLDEDIPFYVGKGKGDRCKNHLDRSIWWKNVVNKHDYYIKILEINLSEEESYIKEIEYISKFGRRQLNSGTLVNLTSGGEGVSGRIYSDEEREVLSKKFKENPELWTSGRRKEYFGVTMFGENNPNFGNKGELNPISKPVVKLSLKGEFLDQYASVTEAAEQNNTKINSVSACCLNKRHQLKGFIYRYLKDYESGEIIITKGKNSKKKVNQLDLITNEIIRSYNSAAETKDFGFTPVNVSQVCRGEKKSHKGFRWEYYE